MKVKDLKRMHCKERIKPLEVINKCVTLKQIKTDI